jgi:hypothetical protein
MRDANIAGQVWSIELGGAYSHTTMGTDDIVRDLRRNIENYGVSHFVKVIEGNSRAPLIVQQVHDQGPAEGFGLIFMDTDGKIHEDFELYKDRLKPRAYLVLDDYFAPGAPNKVGPTRKGIEKLENSGLVECMGIYGWGTWVGRLTR